MSCTRTKKRRQTLGFTLVELLSYTFLSALVLTIMGLFLFSVLKQYAYMSEAATLRKLASLVVHQVKSDIESTTLQALTIGDNGLIIQPIKTIDPPAEIVWSDDIICYQHNPTEQEVIRWTQKSLGSPASGSGLLAFTNDDVQGLRPPDSKVRQWGFVEKFEVSKTAASGVKLEILLRSLDERRHEHSYGMTQFILALNGTES